MRYIRRFFFLLTHSDDDPKIAREAAHVGFLLAALWIALLALAFSVSS